MCWFFYLMTMFDFFQVSQFKKTHFGIGHLLTTRLKNADCSKFCTINMKGIKHLKYVMYSSLGFSVSNYTGCG